MRLASTESDLRTRTALPPFVLASWLVEMEHEDCDLLCAIADAEERGDWREASRLKSRRAGMRAASRAALRPETT